MTRCNPPLSARAYLIGSVITLFFFLSPHNALAATQPYSFPTDHHPHKNTQTELWNLWLLLETTSGNQLALQLRLGRLTLNNQPRPTPTNITSKWSFNNVYVLSAAVTDSATSMFYPQQSLARAALNLAGTNTSGGQLWVNQHTMTVQANNRCGVNLSLSLHNTEHSVSVNLKSTGCPVLQNDDAAVLARGFAQPLQLIDGNWAGDPLVAGHGWLERTWGDIAQALGEGSALALPGSNEAGQQAPVVVDQFRVFLAGQALLVVTRTRRRDGSGTPVLSAAKFMVNTEAGSNNDSPANVDYRRLQVKDKGTWQSINSAEHYTSGWELSWDNESVVLTPLVADQELSTGGLNRWSGLARVESVAGYKSRAMWAFVDLAPVNTPPNQ